MEWGLTLKEAMSHNHYKCKQATEMPLKVHQDPRKVSRKPILATWALKTTTQTISKFRTEHDKKALNNSDSQQSRTSQLQNRRMHPSTTLGNTRRQIAPVPCFPKSTANISINHSLVRHVEQSMLQWAPATNSAKPPSYVEQIPHHL